MARTYRRDARGRFAGGGYSGQSGGRGARLKGGGATRAGGGAKMKAARVSGTLKGRKSLVPTKELARMSRQVKKLKAMEFEPPSSKNNFSPRGGAATKALANIEPGFRRLRSQARDNSFRQRMAISKANKAFETQRAVSTGKLSGQKVKFRSTAAARARYTGQVRDVLSSKKTYGQNKRSSGISRSVVGQQFNLLGRSTPIKSSRRTASNFNANTYKVRGGGRSRLANR